MDEKINAALDAVGLETDNFGRYILGFRNEQGMLYRKEKVDDLFRFSKACTELPVHGFTNELSEGQAKQGCDAIFSLKSA
ncbi:hypothetical protein [Shewanella algae]|uniref:hypothetical protein n=1 Tax=Shewanella algae TaxID=38313 RepID=UPI003004C994